MLSKLSLSLYRLLPRNLISWLGRSNALKPIRNLLLNETDSVGRIVEGKVHYCLGDGREIDYVFHAPPKVLVKAQKSGIENRITRNIYLHCRDLKPGIVLDVGANFGALSIVWATSMPKHSVHSFEVHPHIFKTLEASKKSNALKNLNPWNKAISDKAKTLNFSLNPKTAGLGVGSTRQSTCSVEAITIDSLFAQGDLPVLAIKIDTDGSDYEVLMGCRSVIALYKPYIAVEANNDTRILEELWKQKYEVLDMEGELIPVGAEIDITQSRYCNLFGRPGGAH